MKSMESKLTSIRDVVPEKRRPSFAGEISTRDAKTRFREDYGFPQEIAEELGVILDMFVRDFITEWFRPSVSTD